MFSWVKKAIIDSPAEKLARRVYIRLDPSAGGKYDRETLAIMRRYLTPHSNCIDIGAHRGSILAEIVALSPAGIHYAFEPLPRPYRYLVRSFPSVKTYQLALSNEKGQAFFTHVIDHPTRSSFMQPPGSQEPSETIRVSTDLLDNVIPGDLPIHFIKLDVEGAEYQVLQGGLQTIKRNKPLVLFEHSRIAREYFNTHSADIFDLLAQECGLGIWLLQDWLAGRSSLDREVFARHVEQGSHFYFVAHP